MKLTTNKLSKLLGSPVKVSKGEFTIARPYFYRPSSLTDWKEKALLKITATLEPMGFKVEYVDCGDVWKAFKGGSPVWKQSHFWLKIKVVAV
jgi:hypothetical protein